MPQRANVRSVDAIEAFRSQLVVYLSQARPALDEISAEVVRTRLWLENDQRLQFEHQLLRRRKQLEEAQQALFSSRLGMLKRETALEQMAVHKAKRALEETEGKLRVLKKWVHEFDTRVQPLLKQVEKLQTVLTNDMTQALAYLSQTIQTLSAYAEVHGSPASSPPSTAVSDIVVEKPASESP